VRRLAFYFYEGITVTHSLTQLFKQDQPVVSFELFPPKTEKGEAALYRHVEKLMAFNPDFLTCTYGAGGSTQGKTLEIINEVKKRFDVPVASHLTVVGSTVDQLRDYLQTAKDQSVDYIVALRGDPPQGAESFEAVDGGLSYANELVDLIAAEYSNFGVLVAGYPEKHKEAPNMQVDLENLKRKVDAGSHAIVTQLFYDNDDFFRFRDLCADAGITIPIVPGLLPVTNFEQVKRIASMCAATLPKRFVDRLGERDDKEWQYQVGVEHAIEQTRGLLDAGIEGLHWYVLNRSDATSEILNAVDFNRV
jgi:methylenetetrahydrofolate reductase (NADPH)